MKALKRALPFVVGATMLLASAAQAVTIDFGTNTYDPPNPPIYDPIYNTTDPTIGSVRFSAGDPAAVPVAHDTFVDDGLTGNNYLMSGVADAYAFPPSGSAYYDTFIRVNRTTSARFGTVSVDIAGDFEIPTGTDLVLQAFDGATLLGTASYTAFDAAYHTLSLDLSLTLAGADTLFLSNALNGNNISDTSFRIDNFIYTNWVPQGCTGPNCGGNLPEPSSLLLLGAAALGMAMAKRRKAVLT